MNNFVKIFDELCKKKGVTPYVVAKSTGIAQSTLSDWRHEKYEPTTKKLIMLADYFGVTLDEMVGR